MTGQTLGEGDREKAQKQAGSFLRLGIGLGLLSAVFIMAVSGPIISSYNVSEETAEVAAQLMKAISLIIVFQATNSIMTKGVLRGGGDTKMLMLADNIFLVGTIDTVRTSGRVCAALVGILDICMLKIPPDCQNILVYYPAKGRQVD